MLGPGVLIAGAPMALGYSIHAARAVPDRGPAIAGLVLALVWTGLVVLFVLAVLAATA
jgi:hypothetical protein